jgi:hypothetical protein
MPCYCLNSCIVFDAGLEDDDDDDDGNSDSEDDDEDEVDGDDDDDDDDDDRAGDHRSETSDASYPEALSRR